MGPNRSREHPEGQDREGGWKGPAPTSRAESTGLGQGSHTCPVRGQRMNSVKLLTHVVSAATLSAVLGAQGQPKTIQERTAGFISTRPLATLGPWWVQLQTPGR